MDITAATTQSLEVSRKFLSLHGDAPLLVSSPGRINLIGEHTDYNNGWVLPAAIDKRIFAAVGKRDDGMIHIHAADENQTHTVALDAIAPSSILWPNYILGVVQQLMKRRFPLQGFNLVFGGDIPQGAGLSSSAALECATATALNELFAFGISKLDIALLAQAAENEFVGVKCGLMDQFASVFGREQHLIKVDCSDFSYEYVPFPNMNVELVLFDTQVKHSLASSAYNERREQCEYGVSLIKKHHSEVHSLRDATPSQLERYVRPADQVVYDRCRYVLAEFQRVHNACDALQQGNLDLLGSLLFASHEGLQRQYEVSCPELDVLVDSVMNETDVLGARMMGGGFGGCTINLVRPGQVQQVIGRVSEIYQAKTGKTLQVYRTRIASGTHILTAS